MATHSRHYYPRRLAAWALVAALAAPLLAPAAVALDGTATPGGAPKTIAGPHYTVAAADGTRAGNNLFHSFSTLTLASGETLTFSGDSSINNVIARVTGGARSQIDGKISFSGMPNANFLLINPAGISFGTTGSIDTTTIKQSFTATTADTVTFADGTTMRSTGPLPPLLSVAAPTAFGFISPHQGTIEVQGATLTVLTGKSLALVSGSVHLASGTTLRAANGRVQLVAVGASGTAAVDATNGAAATLTAPPSNGALQLDASSQVVVNGAGSGRIDLLGQQITIQGNVFARTSGSVGTGFRIDVHAIGDCTIDGQFSAPATLSTLAAPMGQLITSTNTILPAGNITIYSGGTLHVANGGLISANTSLNSGSGGRITVNAHDIRVDGTNLAHSVSEISAQSQSSPGQQPSTGGTGGDITLAADTLTVADAGIISAVTFGGGNAGNIVLNVNTLNISSWGQVLAQTGGMGAGGSIQVNTSNVSIQGAEGTPPGQDPNIPWPTGLLADTTSASPGTGGQINVNTQSLSMLPLGVISTTTNGTGSGGNIHVTATTIQLSGGDKVAFTGIGADAQSEAAGAGNGGNINVTASLINVTHAAGIAANTFGPGHGGTIVISADQLTVDGGRTNPLPTGIYVKSLYSADALANRPNALPTLGDAGTIQISAANLIITRGAGITSAAIGAGNGGDITLAGNVLTADSSGEISASSAAAGNAGSIQANFDSVHISGGLVLASVSGSGNGGGIVMTGHSALLDLAGQISASSTGTGEAGNIHLDFNSLHISGGLLTASTSGAGLGGDILINGATLQLDSLGEISASGSGRGKAGSINMQFTSTLNINSGRVLASASGSGDGGDIIASAGTVQLLAGTLAVASTGTGNAGTVMLTSTGDLTAGNFSLSAAANAANGGNLNLTAHSIFATNSRLTAQASGNGGSINLAATDRISLLFSTLDARAGGDGGNITMDPNYVVMRSSDLAADAVFGHGGAILVQTLWYLPSSDSSLTVSSQFGVAGNIAIDTPNPLVSTALAPLIVQVPPPDQLLLDPCEIRFRDGGSSFVVTPSNNPFGIPPLWSPLGVLAAPAVEPATSIPAGDGK